MQRKQSKHLLVLLVLWLAGLMVAGVSRADIILYSAPPNQSGGSDLNGYIEADDVTFASPEQITQIEFWSFQDSATDYAGSIAWSINTDDSGVPGTSVVASGSATPTGVATGNSGFGLNEYSYTFPVSASLTPGTYWVLLHNGPTDTIPSTDFFWEWSADTGNSQSLYVGDTSWYGNFAELALELQGNGVSSVPEPSSMLLLFTGLAGLWFVRARQKN